jgi:glycosyltransferase involved in cell wall biosynthesis
MSRPEAPPDWRSNSKKVVRAAFKMAAHGLEDMPLRAHDAQSDAPLKIAFFCDSFKPTHNGVAVSVQTTAQQLRAHGHHVVIFAPRYPGYEEHEADVVRFPASPLFRVRDFPVAWPILPYFSLAAWSRFIEEEFDIVHSHSPFILGTVGARWAKYSRVPLVFTFHTLYHRYLHYAPIPQQVSRPYTLQKLKRYCDLCDHIIAPSNAIERVVHRFRQDASTSVIPTGVDVTRFASGDGTRARQKFGIAPDEKVLLYVGRIAPEKNLGFMLRSLAPILRNAAKYNARLLLVGDGAAVPHLKSVVQELQLQQRVVLTGFLDERALFDCYAAGDIFVFASRTVTQGVCIAEALAAGLPCVVVGAMGAAESVSDEIEGFVVPPHDDRFCEAVTRLLEDETLRARMAEAARSKARALSLETRVGELVQTYRALLCASSSDSA